MPTQNPKPLLAGVAWRADPKLKSLLAQVAWHAKPLSALAPGFRRLARLVSSSHAQCTLCAKLVDRRLNDTRAEV